MEDTTIPLLQTLERFSSIVKQYGDAKLLKYGRSSIPYNTLQRRALEKLRIIQKSIKSKTYRSTEPCMKDLILVELTSWFNNTFFEWADGISCKVCQMKSPANATGYKGDNRVEILNCCGQQTTFYRYNKIAYLLQTRRGRCGEYANCFTFLCKCLGYDARYVFASFDHVWTEVYSDAQKRWIHIDPSENVLDVPLMYQSGWKRKIDYVIAFSLDDIQDVTWRYTSDHKNTLACRRSCSEAKLLETIMQLRKKRQSNLSDTRKKYLNKRNLMETVQLMMERKPTEDEKRGQVENLYIFTLSEKEITEKQFNIRYCCATDMYERYIKQANGSLSIVTESKKFWQTYRFSSTNIFRKVERDWRMVYLARSEGTAEAEIVWKFDFSNSGLVVRNYFLKFDMTTFKNGNVNVKLIADNNSENIRGSNKFKLIATLSGGEGSIAWQHAQLFRQNSNSNEFPFDFNIQLSSN
ncbi:unnamed protein product [Hermetia illucens]|uniref:Peptide-N(4)-(N-acetyl-beta-glucosaminyl)asparagine amidase n=1 Tax=Hermetia illucens TaxID=343691 RepID=A0A7R8YNP5_HERIL|nr:unnamed protein product [Hermetia illucens]